MADKIQFRRIDGRWRCIAILFIIISLGLLAAVIYLAVTTTKRCTDVHSNENIDVSESDNPGVFDDLTSKELTTVQNYLYSKKELNLVRPPELKLNKSYLFTMDLHLPNKADVLRYLDGKGPKPDRQALVVIFRGDTSPPVVEEYVVGPLPSPSYLRLRFNSNRPNPIPFSYRPNGHVEYAAMFAFLFESCSKLKQILQESYDGGLNFPECGNKCLTFYPTPVGSGVLKENERKSWFILSYSVEYPSLHLLDLAFLLNHTSSNPDDQSIEAVLYNGQRFGSVDEFYTKYNSGEVTKQRVPFPNVNRDLFSTMNLRGNPVPETPKRPPRLFEPDGKRYKITHRYVEYMQWKFHFRMSVFSGPQVYDVKFNDQRIAYEVSLQEFAVFYSGYHPAHMTSDFADSSELLGVNSFGLVPGSDCPDTSTFIDGFYLREYFEKPQKLPSMICIFEENPGFPLRRHAGYDSYHGSFHSGMMDSSLVLRSAITIGNYDYIIDYVFHQNGALQIRAAATGFIFASFYTPEEKDYGFKLHDHLSGNIHHHMFNFKIDIDIHGTSNRYETLDIKTTEVGNDYSVPNATYWQTKFERSLKHSELEAAYKYGFNHPKYHVFHNEGVKTSQGEISGYRIHLEGMSYQPLPEDKGNEATISWARYQLVVTKANDSERTSSSCYAMLDSLEPVVNFADFLADDQSIVDEDLVLWATVGIHHIPHTEDLPVTSTTGGHLGIYLLPYNYFHECPSMASRDAIRLEPKDGSDWASGVKTEYNGNSIESVCLP